MAKEYKYIRFEVIGEKPKTEVWVCFNNKYGHKLDRFYKEGFK